MKVTFLTRPGCHLCVEALTDLTAFLAARVADATLPEPMPIDHEVVDIETDDELHRKYLERIPVILLDGELVSEFAFDPEEFDAALNRRSQGRA